MLYIPKPETPAWKGPHKDGLTQSLIGSWLECPVRAYLKLICGLKDKRPLHPNLVWGDAFHVYLENRVVGVELNEARNIAIDYMYETYPIDSIKDCFEHSIRCMAELYEVPPVPWESEISFSREHKLPSGSLVTIRGKVDGKYENKLLEHKCKGRIPDENAIWNPYPDSPPTKVNASFVELLVDLQINLYSYANNCDEVYYDIIRIPDAQWGFPKQRVGETIRSTVKRAYFEDCGRSQKFPVARHTDHYIMQESFSLPRERQQYLMDTTFNPIAERILEWYEYVTDPNFDPNSPDSYGSIFYNTPVRHFDPSATEYYKCSYHSILTGLSDLSSLSKIPSFYPELNEEETTCLN